MKPKRSLPVGLVCLCFASLTTARLHGDTLYVSSVNNNKVYRVATNGVVTAFATINLLPEGLAFGTNGVLYVGNDGANLINRVSTSGFVSVFATNTAQPYGLAFDSKGNLYAACQSSPAGRIRMVTPQDVVTNFGPTLNAPYGLAIDAGDNVFVSSGYSYIYKITPAGTSSMFGFVNGATGLAFDKAGNLYVAASSGSVPRFTPAGVGSTFATGLGSLVGLAFDNNGNLYAADYLFGVISKIAPDQTLTTFAPVPGNPSFIAVLPPPKFDPGPISIARLGDDVVVSWFGNFVLQSAADATGPFSDIAFATSPYTNALSSAQSGFLRLRN
jgi:sugar lactone lactonase YvrE